MAGAGGLIAGGLVAGLAGLAFALSDDDDDKPAPKPAPKPAGGGGTKPAGGGGGGAKPAAGGLSCADAIKLLPDDLKGITAAAIASGANAANLYTLAETLETTAILNTDPNVKAALQKAAQCARDRAKAIEAGGKVPIFAVNESGEIAEMDDDDFFFVDDDGEGDLRAPDANRDENERDDGEELVMRQPNTGYRVEYEGVDGGGTSRG